MSRSNSKAFYRLFFFSTVLLNDVTFTFSAFSRRFYPMRLTEVHLSEEGKSMHRCLYSKDVNRISAKH